MFTLDSKYGEVIVYAETVEQEAISQILAMANAPIGEDAHMRIMPDCHAGSGCTVGTTMRINDKVCANTVGVDIGCGMAVFKLDFAKNSAAVFDDEALFKRFLKDLDFTINSCIPSGMNIHDHPTKNGRDFEAKLEKLHCFCELEVSYILRSVGSLGGGNHFIELNKTSQGDYVLVIHTGSRYLGKAVATYYQKRAIRELKSMTKEREALIIRYRNEGREHELQAALKALKPIAFPKDLAYCEGELFDMYIHDMKIVQEYAELNRRTIAEGITKNFKSADGLSIKLTHSFSTFHNYIDTENMLLRKGAVSAQKDELLIIPLTCVTARSFAGARAIPIGTSPLLMARADLCRAPTLRRLFRWMSMSGLWRRFTRARLNHLPLMRRPRLTNPWTRLFAALRIPLRLLTLSSLFTISKHINSIRGIYKNGVSARYSVSFCLSTVLY